MRSGRKRSRFQHLLEWSGLDLIDLRNDCHVGMVRVETALDEKDRQGIEIPEPVRKNTMELIATLRNSMIALSDLECERNVATHNATIEKASHARTIAQLDKANKRVQQLELEGARLRAAIEKHFSK